MQAQQQIEALVKLVDEGGMDYKTALGRVGIVFIVLIIEEGPASPNMTLKWRMAAIIEVSFSF